MRKKGLLIVLSVFFINVQAQDKSAFVKTSFVMNGDTLPVRILYPENFDPSQKYPLMLFLHGRGESGSDNEKQLTHGSKMFLDPAFRNKYKAVVIFPQCAKDSYWSNVNITTDEKGKRHFSFLKGGKPTKAMSLLMAYIDELNHLNYLDKERLYIGGLSMGGMGTYEVLRRTPDTFAAAFVICGGDNVKNVRKYANKLPLWLFHSAKDDVVDPQFTLDIAKKLKQNGSTYKLTIYPNANHNSWDPAFAEPQLLPWLFSQKKDNSE